MDLLKVFEFIVKHTEYKPPEKYKQEIPNTFDCFVASYY